MKLVLPELGEGIQNAVVACWHAKVGDRVEEGDEIVEVVTDKASFGVPAPQPGIVKEIIVAEGQTVPIGEALAILE